MNQSKLLFAVLIGLISSCISANDSTGYVATGGVTYLKNPNIRMASEDLYISEDHIRVRYEFVNDAPQNVTETVLFPMPVIDYAKIGDGDFAHPNDLINSFRIKVDGRIIQPILHTRGFWQGKDITSALTDCGFSQREIAYPYYDINRNEAWYDRVSACFGQMASNAIIQKPTADEPVWAAQVIYSWQQTFLSKKTLKVEHEYTPLVGGGVMMGLTSKSNRADWVKSNCLDTTFTDKLKASGARDASYSQLGYVLTTGANWARPIGQFHLTIDKKHPNDLISLCWDSSLKKTSPTRFEAFKTNFTPTRDIDIVFAKPLSKY